MQVLSSVSEMQKDVIFHGQAKDSPWTTPDAVKRFNVVLPFYPFRTLNPRELFLARQLSPGSGGGGGGGETSSPLIPAHTQLNFCFKRRSGNSILDQMVIHQLSPRLGSTKDSLTKTERDLALQFGGAGTDPAVAEHQILDVQIKLHNVWLQVIIFFSLDDLTKHNAHDHCCCPPRWCESSLNLSIPNVRCPTFLILHGL